MSKRSITETERGIDRVQIKAKVLADTLERLNGAMKETRAGLRGLAELPDLAGAACHLSQAMGSALEAWQELPCPDCVSEATEGAQSLAQALTRAVEASEGLPSADDLNDRCVEAQRLGGVLASAKA